MSAAKKTIPDKQRESIRRAMEARRTSVSALTKKAGMTEGALRNFLNGVNNSMGSDKIALLANALGLSIGELLGEGRRLVTVVGYVGAGAEVYPIDDHPKGAGIDEVECPPGLNPDEAVALKIRGDSMLPFMAEGSIVYYESRADNVCSEHLNKLCVVRVHNGATLLKIVKRGYKKDHYNLMSYNADMIEDVRVDWCAKILFMKFS